MPFRNSVRLLAAGAAGIAAVGLSLAIGAASAGAATVTIAGTHTVPDANISASGNYRPFKIDTSVLFNPLAGPITVTGSVDIGSLPQPNSTTYFGLIAKQEYDAWVAAGYDPNDSQTSFFGFLDTAYGAFNTSGGGRLGLGQHLPNFDIVQSYPASGLGTSVSGFTVTFEATQMTLEIGAATATQSYQDTLDYLEWVAQNFPTPRPSLPTDWSQGAYAFVGSWFDKAGGSSTVDLTFSGPALDGDVAEPATLALLGAGLAGLGLIRRRRRA